MNTQTYNGNGQYGYAGSRQLTHDSRFFNEEPLDAGIKTGGVTAAAVMGVGLAAKPQILKTIADVIDSERVKEARGIFKNIDKQTVQYGNSIDGNFGELVKQAKSVSDGGFSLFSWGKDKTDPEKLLKDLKELQEKLGGMESGYDASVGSAAGMIETAGDAMKAVDKIDPTQTFQEVGRQAQVFNNAARSGNVQQVVGAAKTIAEKTTDIAVESISTANSLVDQGAVASGAAFQFQHLDGARGKVSDLKDTVDDMVHAVESKENIKKLDGTVRNVIIGAGIIAGAAALLYAYHKATKAKEVNQEAQSTMQGLAQDNIALAQQNQAYGQGIQELQGVVELQDQAIEAMMAPKTKVREPQQPSYMIDPQALALNKQQQMSQEAPSPNAQVNRSAAFANVNDKDRITINGQPALIDPKQGIVPQQQGAFADRFAKADPSLSQKELMQLRMQDEMAQARNGQPAV